MNTAVATRHPLPAAGHSAAVWFSLLTVWIVWGTTYLAIKFALAGLAPFWQMATRFVAAGGLLFAWLALRGAPMPTARQWRDCAIVGGLMIGGAMGLVATGQQWISSGATTVLIAVMPVWLAIWQGVFGRWPSGRDWIGIALGTAGVLVLASGAEFRASPAGLAAIVGATLCWSLGSMLSTRLDIPKGPTGFAAEMVAGSIVLLALSLAAGEQWVAPWAVDTQAFGAWLYLVFAGSLLAFSAYMYLMANVKPTLAASYTYVNPAVALLVGVWLGGETVSPQTLVALPAILGAVALLLTRRAG
jgi:drug/metabolite transporter (DMT)-like permease